METFFATLLAFALFTLALSMGILIKGRVPSTCSTARKAGDHGEIACGSCAVIDKDDCKKNPYYQNYLRKKSDEALETSGADSK